MRTFDGKFLEFPLSCLAYCKNDIEKLKELLAFHVVGYALKMDSVEINFNEIVTLPEDFEKENPIHQKIVEAAVINELMINNIVNAIDTWIRIKDYVNDYEKRFGNDSYCRIGKQFLIETVEKKIPQREFMVYCALQSVIGKKKLYTRITYDRIAYCMLGYKKKYISVMEGAYTGRITNRQIAICVEKLRDKRLITTVTYFREKYYSTRIKTNERLREIIAHKKFKKAEKLRNVPDKEWARFVNKEVKRIRKTSTSNRYYLDDTLRA